jgi:CRP-like cAMP-binding protein
MARLTPTTRSEVLKLGRTVRFLPDSVLLREGEATRHALAILRGYAKITAATEDGDCSVLSVRAPGDIVGEMAALSGMPRSATVVSCTPLTVILLGEQQFGRFLQHCPEANRALEATLGDRLRWANRRRVEINGYDAEMRLTRLLLELAQLFGRPGPDGCHIDVRLTQSDLASLAGVGRASAERTLRSLQDRGLIRRLYRSVAVRDLAGLSQAAKARPTDPLI